MGSERKIEIWEIESAPDAKAALPALGRAKFLASEIDMSIFSGNLKQLLVDFQVVFDSWPKSPSGYYVDEIELNLGVNGKGGIALIGKLEMGVQAGIKVKIRRKNRD